MKEVASLSSYFPVNPDSHGSRRKKQIKMQKLQNSEKPDRKRNRFVYQIKPCKYQKWSKINNWLEYIPLLSSF